MAHATSDQAETVVPKKTISKPFAASKDPESTVAGAAGIDPKVARNTYDPLLTSLRTHSRSRGPGEAWQIQEQWLAISHLRRKLRQQ